jgi:hypothetical protein
MIAPPVVNCERSRLAQRAFLLLSGPTDDHNPLTVVGLDSLQLLQPSISQHEHNTTLQSPSFRRIQQQPPRDTGPCTSVWLPKISGILAQAEVQLNSVSDYRSAIGRYTKTNKTSTCKYHSVRRRWNFHPAKNQDRILGLSVSTTSSNSCWPSRSRNRQ